MNSPLLRSSTNSNRRHSRPTLLTRTWRITKPARIFASGRTSDFAPRTPVSSSGVFLLSPRGLRSPRLQRHFAEWLGQAAWEPAWERGHLRFREEQARWDEEERKGSGVGDWVFGVVGIFWQYEIVEWPTRWWWWWWLAAVVPVAVTLWAGYEYAAWGWERYLEVRMLVRDGREEGKVLRFVCAVRDADFRGLLEGPRDVLVRLWVYVYREVRESIWVRGFCDIMGVCRAMMRFGLRRSHELDEIREIVADAEFDTEDYELYKQYAKLVSFSQNTKRLEKTMHSAESFLRNMRCLRELELVDRARGMTTDPVHMNKTLNRVRSLFGILSECADIGKHLNLHALLERCRMVINAMDFGTRSDGLRARRTRSASVVDQLADDFSVIFSENTKRNMRGCRPETIPLATESPIRKPYWSRSLEKPAVFGASIDTDPEIPQSKRSFPGPSVVQTSPGARNDGEKDFLADPVNEGMASAQPLGNLAMLRRWATKVSDLCEVCHEIWDLFRHRVTDSEHMRARMEQLDMEHELVRNLDPRVVWASIPAGSITEALLIDCSIARQQLKHIREQVVLTESHDAIFHKAWMLLRDIISRHDTQPRALKHIQSLATNMVVSDGFMLSQLQTMRKEVGQLAQSRVQMVDSLYLLGQAYSNERLVADHISMRSQLWSLVARSRMICLGSTNAYVHRASEEVAKAIEDELAAWVSEVNRSKFTRSLNDFAAETAEQMLQDSEMAGLTPVTPHIVFGCAIASATEITACGTSIVRAAGQINFDDTMEVGDRFRFADKIETEIREHLKQLSDVVDYSDDGTREQVDKIFRLAHAELLVVRAFKTAQRLTFVHAGELGDNLPGLFGLRRASLELLTPTQHRPTKRIRLRDESLRGQKRARSRASHATCYRSLQRRHLFATATDVVAPKRPESVPGPLADRLASLSEAVDLWRSSSARLMSVYIRRDPANPWAPAQAHQQVQSDENDEKVKHKSLEEFVIIPEHAVGAASAQTVAKISNHVLIDSLRRLDSIRCKAESLLGQIVLERNKIISKDMPKGNRAAFADTENQVNQILDYLCQCAIDIGHRGQRTDPTRITYEEAQLYASVACFIGLRQGSFKGRYNNVAQLEQAQADLQYKFDAVNKRACGAQVPAELLKISAALETLEYLRCGANRLLQRTVLSAESAEAVKIRTVLDSLRAVERDFKEPCDRLKTRHDKSWYLDGPKEAIEDLQHWVQRQITPCATDDWTHLCGPRALLMSLQTFIQSRPELMLDGTVPGVEYAEELLCAMFDDFEEKAKTAQLPTISTPFLATPTSRYAAFLLSHLHAVEMEHGRGSATYRQHWDEVTAISDWSPRQMQTVLDFLRHGELVPLPAINLRLGVVCRDAGDYDPNTKATVELFGEEAESGPSIIIWVYNDNAAAVDPGSLSQWQGFASTEQAPSEAAAIVQSWFEGKHVARLSEEERMKKRHWQRQPSPLRGQGGITIAESPSNAQIESHRPVEYVERRRSNAPGESEKKWGTTDDETQDLGRGDVVHARGRHVHRNRGRTEFSRRGRGRRTATGSSRHPAVSQVAVELAPNSLRNAADGNRSSRGAAGRSRGRVARGRGAEWVRGSGAGRNTTQAIQSPEDDASERPRGSRGHMRARVAGRRPFGGREHGSRGPRSGHGQARL